MRHGKNSAYGRRARREGALERLQASKFTPKVINKKERNEKNWTEKKEEQIKILEGRLNIRRDS
jgi:hypothetical protein|tara:strand:+ start:148 stop:339 length:192 start_codon:yes stop_codon:yes gene_type:complete